MESKIIAYVVEEYFASQRSSLQAREISDSSLKSKTPSQKVILCTATNLRETGNARKNLQINLEHLVICSMRQQALKCFHQDGGYLMNVVFKF